jgi:hypothetical protein
MTPEERQMITGLFDRMRSYGTPQKDREAETIINEGVRSTPDAGYMLVQSVLVQEHALQEAGNRIKDLEEQVRNLRSTGQERAPESGSFLGGLFGAGRPASQPGPSSVPVIGSRAPAPSAYEQDERRPWQQGAPPQQQAVPAGGGFLRSAMATAAGVAGGMLAAGAIRDLMGGTANSNNANTPAATSASTEQAQQDREQDARQDASDTEQAQQDQNQDALQDASDDDSSWGDSGGDLDI